MLPAAQFHKRLVVFVLINQGLSDIEIQRVSSVDHKTAKKIRMKILSGENIFMQQTKIGAPTKRTTELIEYIDKMTKRNRRMSNEELARIIRNISQLPNVSPSTVQKIRRELGYKFLPPLRTFFLSDEQKIARLAFCVKHLNENTKWDNVLFTDECYFWLGEDHRPLYRKRGEHTKDVLVHEKKFNEKILVFGGISRSYKTNLIVLQNGTVDAITYIDDLIDESGLIPSMNEVYGVKKWVLMQDGASAHTAKVTLDYLRTYVNILENWPAMSPDLNPIENLWAIMKAKVSELRPQNKEQLIEYVIAVWNSLEQQMISNLVDSMKERLEAVVKNNGEQTDF